MLINPDFKLEAVNKLAKEELEYRGVYELYSQNNYQEVIAKTNSIVENGKQKLSNKKLDLLFANNATDTFNSDSISVTAITAEKEFEISTANKNVVARKMLTMISEKVKS